MSGIAGILHLDQAPVNQEFVAAMADALAFRGPDAQNVWTDGQVGFAHTLLATTFESEGERQPASLDGQVWITADARVDGRQDLARELGLPQSALQRPDCELILHAYAKWGEDCVEHLIGDFAFAIWDGRARKLFCARDHFGVKPFYCAHIGTTFLFSNTLNCIRIHPDVSDELNELAIADFLIFDFNQDPATTTFQDIQRLPAAHLLIADATGVRTRRYWSLPEGESIRYRRTRDYVEHFTNLLETAVSDRLRTKKVTIRMSGGLDSSSVAAFARRIHPEVFLHAHTMIFESLMPDDERYYAGVVAKHINIPTEFHPIDDIRPFENVENRSTPEPVHSPLSAVELVFHRQIASQAPIVLTGQGADSLFSLSTLNWRSIRSTPLCLTVTTFARYIWQMRTVPKFRLRSTLRHLLARSSQSWPVIPAWLNQDFARRCVTGRLTSYSMGIWKNESRPAARLSVRAVGWPTYFETDDPAWSGYAIESRHPFFDTRILRYILAIPDLPYCMDKLLIRLSTKGLLPSIIRTRPKTPLRADHLFETCKLFGLPDDQERHPMLSRFVSNNWTIGDKSSYSREQVWIDSRPITLNRWLNSQENLCAKQRPRLG